MVYEDSLGVLTVGVGRNLRDVPFANDEIDLMFKNDFQRAKSAAETFYVYERLNEARRGVLTEMCFQMGYGGVSRFKKFLSAALREDWSTARDEMLNSTWARQTPTRASRLAHIFKTGEE